MKILLVTDAPQEDAREKSLEMPVGFGDRFGPMVFAEGAGAEKPDRLTGRAREARDPGGGGAGLEDSPKGARGPRSRQVSPW